eukprot:CAMPEP_0178561082 /NCGR_PEP_ID=MMETSP0697-20121206/11820_1 /TAXON_ID=265572 /ORGANISM="Extubocellulus spinifer, Strain CCMP396" /LENGTH=429 /DNA_ID=CAMNT_0020194361 /DNA_START=152 /DNA_END=1441 /DNA_ORIENTATION=-
MKAQGSADALYQKDPGVEYGRRFCNNGTDWCMRFFQFLHFTLAILAFVFSLQSLTSCDFLTYSWPPNGLAPPGVPPDVTAGDLVGSPTQGIWKHNPTGGVCIEYANEIRAPGPALRASRLCSVIGSAFGAIALLLLLIELTCCRFWCSRVIVMFVFIIACIGQAFTLTLLLGEVCGGRKGNKYLCDLGNGAKGALVATALYLSAAIFACCIPKSIPILRVMRDMEALSVVDSGCCCKGRTREDILEEQTELIEMITDADTSEDEDGLRLGLPGGMFGKAESKEYPQNYDSNAGVTLRDQYNASYDRWVRAENVYDQALDRFKEECADAGLEWRNVRTMSSEEIEDDEVRRLVFLLADLKSKCEGARETMETFRGELGSAMAPPAAVLSGGDADPEQPEINEPDLEHAGDKKEESSSTSILAGSFQTPSN